MDSVRWEQFKKSDTPYMDELKDGEYKSFTTASWTLPSLKSMIHGLLPSPRHKQIFDWIGPFDVPITKKGRFKNYNSYAYSCNPAFTPRSFPGIFDGFRLLLNRRGKGLNERFIGDLGGIEQPFIAFLLYIDTHHPYLGKDHEKETQKEAITYMDKRFKELFDRVPENTTFYITSDHGEIFPEDNLSNKKKQVGGHDPRPSHEGCLGYEELFKVPMVVVGK